MLGNNYFIYDQGINLNIARIFTLLNLIIKSYNNKLPIHIGFNSFLNHFYYFPKSVFLN